MTHPELAKAYFEQGYNCAQAVFLAFSDLTKLDQSTALRLSSSFGGGMGRMREVCGAVSGAAMLVGFKYGATDGDDTEAKQRCYQVVQQIIAEFKKNNPSIVCRELLEINEGSNTDPKPEARTEAYYKKRPCAEYVRMAATIVGCAIRDEKI